MANILSVISAALAGKRLIKESAAPVLPPIENYDLYQQDILSGSSPAELRNNQKAGKYKRPEHWREPRRNAQNQIVIENNDLWKSDLQKYGYTQAMKWAEHGKYNNEGGMTDGK